MTRTRQPVSVTDRDGIRRRLAALRAIPPSERSGAGDDVRIVRTFRGLTPDAAVRCLEGLGGERVDDRTVAGPGWTAEPSAGTAPVGPSYLLTEVTVTRTGDEAALAPVITGFRLKAFRAPG